MALVNPNIAMSYRQPDIQAPNALAQYAQIQQIQGGQQAQELARFQLGAAQRGEARDIARINALAGAGTDETAVANALLKSGDIAGYSAFVKAAEDRRTQKLTQQKTQGDIAAQPLALQKTQGEIDAQQIAAAKGRADAFSTALAPLVGAVQSKKPITHQDVFAQANRLVSQGLLRKEDLYSIPINVAELPNFVMNMASSTENSRKALEAYLPKAMVAGGNVINVNPLAEGGIGNDLGRVSMTEAQLAQNRIAEQQLTVSQGQLGVAQQRLAWEKANPGFELQQDAEGNFYGVNKRTMQATPVIVGGAAPAVAPAAPGAGMPGPRVPAPAAQAIPGMTSVLDKPAPAAAPAPGSQLKGAPKSKDISVSEQQASYNIARVLNAADEIGKITKKDPKALAPGAGEAFAKSIGAEGTANVARSTNRQIVNGAQRDALDALLYLATGAAYNKEQLQGAFEAYIPSYTDDTGTRQAKQARMTSLIQDAKVRAGKAWTPKMDAAMQSLTGSSAPAAAANIPVPKGVDAALWNVMTPEERKLWAK
jgi:hypothetical protein